MQVNPGKYKGLVSGMRLIMAEEGAAAVFKGWAPTLIGYSMQGFCKFGFYEIFKDLYANMVGKEVFEQYRGLVWLAASASAEVFADIALCPMEMVKVKVQTSPAGTFPTGLFAATAKMNELKADTRFPFGSLVPLWSRQIPYTMAKFYFFEKVRGKRGGRRERKREMGFEDDSKNAKIATANSGSIFFSFYSPTPLPFSLPLFSPLPPGRVPVLRACFHRAPPHLFQVKAAVHHLHVWLLGRCHLRDCLSPGGHAGVAAGQGPEQGQGLWPDRFGIRLPEPLHQGPHHPYHYDWYPDRPAVVDLRQLQDCMLEALFFFFFGGRRRRWRRRRRKKNTGQRQWHCEY